MFVDCTVFEKIEGGWDEWKLLKAGERVETSYFILDGNLLP